MPSQPVQPDHETLPSRILRSRLSRRLWRVLGLGRSGLGPINPLFDHDYYSRRYPDVPTSRRRSWMHFVRHGAAEGRDPNAWFSTSWYLETNPDVVDGGLNPLDHYYHHGEREGREPGPAASTDTRREAEGSSRVASLSSTVAQQYVSQVLATGARDNNDYVPYVEHSDGVHPLRAIAFYLPQFHPIPENDEWWGKGFTEWSNVGRAAPQFVGHYQPRLPGELGYYDLRLPSVMRTQVDLARNYGIGGFCFHYYSFGGRRLLEQPLDTYLDDPSLDLPFCVSWANENWTRRWDGREQDILIAQPLDQQAEEDFAMEVVPLMRDRRYLRVGGLPILLVYRPSLLTDAPRTAARWRETFRAEGVGEVLLGTVQFDIDDEDPRRFDFDVAVEFPPQNVARGLPRIDQELAIVNSDYRGSVHRYSDLIEVAGQVPEPAYPLIRGVMPGWDNTARRLGRGTCFHGSSPDLYRRWLARAGRYAIEHPVNGEALIFINAWNEWGEGAYLEPDRRYGYAYLESSRLAIQEASRESEHETRRILLMVHDARNHGAQRTALNLARTLHSAFAMHLDIVLLEGGELASQFREFGTVHDLTPLRSDLRAQQTILRAIRDSGTSTAFCNTVVTGRHVKRLKALGFRVLTLVHELPGVIEQFQLVREANDIARHSDIVVFPAQEVRSRWEEALGAIHTDVVIRPQGLYRRPRSWRVGPTECDQARSSLGLPQDAEVVLAVGFADLRKGIDIFMRVFEAVRRVRPRAVFVWLGCEERQQLLWFGREAESLGFAELLRLIPRVDDVELYYQAASLLLLPSREDPFPSVVMEALSHNIPVIAFEGATGSVDLLDRGAGIAVPYADATAMTEATLKLLSDPDERMRMGTVGQTIVREEFSWVDYVADLVALGGYHRPTVSVVIPNYNYARYLPERLASVAGQTYPIKEIIVLDDASTDDSIEVIERVTEELGLRKFVIEVNERKLRQRVPSVGQGSRDRYR